LTKIISSSSIQEKILSTKGNILITANPGTGKTYLLAKKYSALIKNKIPEEEILCLTFTNKAKREMEERIIKVLEEEKIKVDLSKLNVYTFHSYALDYIDEGEIISTNLLRFVIYEYLKEKEVFNYSDERLVSEVVPRLENLMRYLKSYGITPDKIDKKKTRDLIVEYERSKDVIDKEDLEKFLDYFVEIFTLYEKEKARKGIDYADLLINFLKLKNKPKFKYVLVDELQDVNNLEAQIALQSGETFFAVGDKKQAIFGFQGGSIENFDLFKKKKPTEFNLIENRRSTQQILDFASTDFKNKSKDNDSKIELEGLKNFEGKKGKKTKIIEADREEVIGKICCLLNQLKGDEKIAILVRTNAQIIELAKELQNRNIEFSSTHIASSVEARANTIRFLKAIFSSNVEDVKNAFFTPFFPINLQKAFELTAKRELTIREIYKECPEFKRTRESQKDLETIATLFTERIYPACIPYGEEYLLATEALQRSAQEALTLIGNKTLENFIHYLEATDLLSSTAKREAKITLTTIHKAKGLEYDKVIYWAKKTRDNSGFYDYVIERILESEGKLETVELEEELLRIDFVAYTRAKNELYVIAENARDYSNEHSELLEIEAENTSANFEEKQKRAYNLFLNKNYEGAKKLLEINNAWIKSFVEDHFANLEHISFSKLTTDPYEYFIQNILQLREESFATSLGSNVHDLIQSYLEGKKVTPEGKEKLFFDNAKELISKIRKDYPDFVEAEHKVYIPLSTIVGTKDKINFKGYIDAVFRNDDNYLIADWKTSKSTDGASEYRRQLELYKRAYATEMGIKPEKIKVAIGFIGLREIINDGNVYSSIDQAQPKQNVFETLQKHFQKFLEWKADPKVFLDELCETRANDPLIRAVIEQYRLER
jgi:DNA helicase II / ATP-dependent DNA helicase PcrA